ncbi:hypothetical protein TRVA0_002S04544 [Trichomonascus vanleenenianus]|uniref:Rme1p n=1 Tax=Trichomonascus vanleenenianus TaxID=2268995 RepID=UPI003EC95F8B
MPGISSVLSAKKTSPVGGRKRPQPLKAVGEGCAPISTVVTPSQKTSSSATDLSIEFFKSANSAKKKDSSWAKLSPLTATTPSVAVFGRGHYRQFLTTPSAIFFESPMSPRFLTGIRNSGIVYPLRTPKQLLPPRAQRPTLFDPQFIQIEHNPIPHKEDEPTVLFPRVSSTDDEARNIDSTPEAEPQEAKSSDVVVAEDGTIPMDEDLPDAPLDYALPPLPSTEADKDPEEPSQPTTTISINPECADYSHEKAQRFILDQILACGERLAVTIDKEQAEPFRLVTAPAMGMDLIVNSEDQELARLLEEENRRVDDLKAAQKRQEDWKEEYWQKSAAATTSHHHHHLYHHHNHHGVVENCIHASVSPEVVYSTYGYGAPPAYCYSIPPPFGAYYGSFPFQHGTTAASFVVPGGPQYSTCMNPSEAVMNPALAGATSPVQPSLTRFSDAEELPHQQPSPDASPRPAGSPLDQLMDFPLQASPDTNPYVVRAREGSIVYQLSQRPDLWPRVIGTKKGVFRCSHCGDKFPRLIQFAAHIDEAHVPRPFPCSDRSCPWSIIGFSKRSENSRHMKHQHAPHRLYGCEYATCLKSFSRKDSLKRHLMLVHDNSMSRRNKKLRILAEKKRRGNHAKYDEIQEDFE